MVTSRVRKFPHRVSCPSFLPGLLACSAGFALLLSGCAAPPVEEKVVVEPAPALVWPAPPDPARIRYVESISLLGDLAEKKGLTLAEKLLGKEEAVQFQSLIKPYAVHSDGNGRLFITDSVIAGLIVYDRNKKSSEFWGTEGLGTLASPMGITSDSTGNVYVSDATNKSIVVFDNNGKYLKSFGGSDILTNPVGLAFNNDTRRLYAVDSKQHQVLVFDEQGNLDFKIGERGSANGTFNFPSNIAIDPDGLVYVADSMNFRIQIFEPDGTFVRKIGQVGNTPGSFSRLKGVGLDTDGHIYAVDAAFSNFQIFDQQGQLLLFIGGGGSKRGQFSLPAGLHVDENGEIFVSDQMNRRIEVFQYIKADSPE